MTNKSTEQIVVEILGRFGAGDSVHLDCPLAIHANLVSRIRMKISRERAKLKKSRVAFRDFKLNVKVESCPKMNQRWCRVVMTRTVEPAIKKEAIDLLYQTMDSQT